MTWARVGKALGSFATAAGGVAVLAGVFFALFRAHEAIGQTAEQAKRNADAVEVLKQIHVEQEARAAREEADRAAKREAQREACAEGLIERKWCARNGFRAPRNPD